jgi:hypothetical protein
MGDQNLQEAMVDDTVELDVHVDRVLILPPLTFAILRAAKPEIMTWMTLVRFVIDSLLLAFSQNTNPSHTHIQLGAHIFNFTK